MTTLALASQPWPQSTQTRSFHITPGCLPDKYGRGDPLTTHAALVNNVKNGRITTFGIPGLGTKLQAFENTRKSRL